MCVLFGDYMKKLAIFGFDGILADTSPGILYCFNTTAIAMGYQPVDKKALVDTVGIPLETGFKMLYDMTDDEIKYAANNYAKLYSQKGKEMVSLYDGVNDSIIKLRQNGFKIAIATQKHEMYTTDIIKACGNEKLFDAVCATDVNINLDKNDIILKACNELSISAEDSVYVGGNKNDAVAAQKANVDFAAVLYGLGFKSKEDSEEYDCKAYISRATDIATEILKI